ncbi:MAG: hypothetical protein GY915_01765 [bacterium]|nr:hypothetical protein [bacterium]
MALFWAFVGMSFGSFACASAWRASTYASFFQPSSCPRCFTHLRPWQLVPLASWIAQKGKCTYCREPISVIYPFSELVLGLYALVLYNLFPNSMGEIVWWLILGTFLWSIALTDVWVRRIPNVFLLALLGLSFFSLSFGAGWLLFVIASLLYLFGSRFTGDKRPPLGWGDVKLMIVFGLMMPISGVPAFLISSGVWGIAWGLWWRYFKKERYFPFAPALALAFLSTHIYLNPKAVESMDVNLKGPILLPLNGEKPDSAVLIFHGYGASGDDLISIGKVWKMVFPRTVFIAPHGVQTWDGGGPGRQWFSLKDYTPQNLKVDPQEMLDSLPQVQAYIDHVLKHYDIPASRLVLMGFSQGCMLALRAGLGRKEPVAGILGYSGAFITEEGFKPESVPPVMLFHGKQDEAVPYRALVESEKALKALGVNVTAKSYSPLGHGISEEVVRDGLVFLRKVLDTGEATHQKGEMKSGTK